MRDFYVLCGGAGAGKTTVLTELQNRGYACVPDTPRQIIRDRLQAGLPPRPDPLSFATTILATDIDNYEANLTQTEPVFFDRSVLDALGGLHHVQPIDETQLQTYLQRFTYGRVFLFPAWEQIYTTDSERDHSFEHALAVYNSTLTWYTRFCHYTPVEVPIGTVSDRADFIESQIL